ncbi:MAG: SDR family oxidoreductase [Myxococcota bacterium]
MTGASTGIGRATAEALVEHGFHVFGSVRKQADGESLREQLGDAVTPLHFDVTDAEAIAAAVPVVQEYVGDDTLVGLVNNAGVAIGGALMHMPDDELRRQFDINVFGLMAVTRAFLPLLGARRPCPGPPGRIVNISSVAGRISAPFVGAYSASKHAVEALSDSLRRELMIYGVDVVVIQPGAIKTPIWDKAEAEDTSRYADTHYAEIAARFQEFALQKGRNGLETSRVSGTIVRALTVRRPKTRYPIPDEPWMGWRLPLMLPERWIDQAIAKQLGLTPPKDD